MDISNFCHKINYTFRDQSLLQEALSHPSLSNDVAVKNYQRLEFLGDKVLSLIISEYLMSKYPNETEGDLSKRHAALVSGETLAEIATLLDISEVLQISFGERKLGGNHNKKNLENALEALIGAIYLDSNFAETKNFVMHFWHDYLEKNLTPPQDPVSQLQELVQSQSRKLPLYETFKSGGSEHDPIFTSIVKIKHLGLEFSANGRSKKEAQREVSRMALLGLIEQ